jgi:SpoIID/LytB domain protein
VVNVLPVEQYLRGVVPLELSPGPHPQLEALKAQAIAARSYALASRGRFRSEGFDLRDDARSQVYGGLSAELPLTDRAVEETKGIVAAYLGDDGKYAPIEALYTANCGGHTENNEAVFLTKPVPYLRAVECRVDNASSVGREIASTTLSEALVSAEGRRLAREVALLRVLGFWLPRKVTSRYLSVAAEEDELLDWLEHTSRLFRRSLPDLWRVDARRVDVFSQLIAALVYGPGRATFMLTPADTNYLLSGLGLSHVPREARTSIALLVRDGILRLPGDGRLNGQDTVTHELAIEALARAAIARSKLGGLDNDSSKDIAGAVALRSRPKSTPAAAPPARRQPKANRLASKKTTQSNTPAKKGTQQLSSGTSGARTNKTLKAAKAAGSKPTAGKNVKKPSTGNRKDAGRAIGQAGNRPRRLSSSSPALRLDLYTALAAPAQEGRLIVAQRGESPKPRARTQSSTTNVGLQLTKPASEAQSRKFDVDAAALLFRRLGGESYAVSRLTLIGGERVIYHVNAAGRVDFIEAEPAEESAASDILGAYQWIERMNADEVRRKLAAVRIDVGEVEDLAPAELGESGRVTELEIVGNRGRARLRGYHIRSVLGLKENLFVIDRKQEPGRQLVFVFAGRGWGHGVGMCQTGAYGLAKAGYSYRAIIQKYYSGVRVRKIY